MGINKLSLVRVTNSYHGYPILSYPILSLAHNKRETGNGY